MRTIRPLCATIVERLSIEKTGYDVKLNMSILQSFYTFLICIEILCHLQTILSIYQSYVCRMVNGYD